MPSIPVLEDSLCLHLYICLPSGVFPSGFLTKTLDVPLLSSLHATCSAHLILLDLITLIYLVRSADHKVLLYVVFFTPLFLRPS